MTRTPAFLLPFGVLVFLLSCAAPPSRTGEQGAAEDAGGDTGGYRDTGPAEHPPAPDVGRPPGDAAPVVRQNPIWSPVRLEIAAAEGDGKAIRYSVSITPTE